MATLKQIQKTLRDLDKSESRLDNVVCDSIEHCLVNTFSPDALNAVHAHLIAHNHTTLAKRYREYVKGTSPMFWHEGSSTFKLNKKARDNAEEFGPVWAANLGKFWRIQLDKPESDKPTTRTLAQRVQSAKARAEKDHTPSTQERIEAAKVLLADMTAAEIVTALGDKADFVLDALIPAQAA